MAPAEPYTKPFRQIGDVPEFPEEIEGWKGYIEWEKYPEKRAKAEAIMKQYDFPEVGPDTIYSLTTKGVTSLLISPNSLPSSRWLMCHRTTHC